MADKTDLDQEFEDFNANGEEYIDPALDDLQDVDVYGEGHVDDAEFQDLADELDDADVFEDAPAREPAKGRKTNWFNVGVAAVAVLVAGGLVLSKLLPNITGGGTGGAIISGPEIAGAQGNASEDSAQAAIQAQDSGPAVQGGMLDNPDAFAGLVDSAAPSISQSEEIARHAPADPFAALSQTRDAEETDTDTVADGDVPMPAPIVGENHDADSVMVSEILPPAQTAPDQDFWAGLDQGAPNAPVAADTQAEIRTPAASSPVASAEENASPQQPVAVASGQTNMPTTPVPDDSALRAQVETLSSRLSSLEGKVDAAIANVAKQASVQTTSTDDARFERIQSALERLETRLDDMAKAPRTVPAAERTTPRAEPRAESAAPAREQAASTPRRTIPEKATVVAATKAPARPAPSRAASREGDAPYRAASSAQASSWRLRGAQPGQAIIGQASGDVREVRVGDFVPGLGQITGVASIDGKWIVQGTQGRITQ